MEHLVKVLSDLANSGREIVLVSSGAVAVGCGKAGIAGKPEDITMRQAAAAIGQGELMHLYDKMFGAYNHKVAQMLLTRDVVDNDSRRSTVEGVFARLFELRCIPVVNENDVVSTDEIGLIESFGDNDTLSAVVAALCNADALVILSDIDGLYDGDPRENPGAKLIPVVERLSADVVGAAAGTGSARGTGGMATKINAARIAMGMGIDMAIINGADPNLLYKLFDGEAIGTHFVAGG
jgi:glutamate 5-kinase